MSEIKLEVGKTYVNRKGEEVKITTKAFAGRPPYQGDNGNWYTENGRWDYFGPEDPEDLVEEVSMSSTSQKYDKMTAPKLEVGKTYRNREGKEVRIVGFDKRYVWPYHGSDGERYAESGQWRSMESPHDLVEEIPEPRHAFITPDEAKKVTATRYTFAIPDGAKGVTVSQEGNRIIVEMVPEKAPKPGDSEFKEGDVVFEGGRIMIVKMYPNSYHAMFYPNYGKLFINGLYGVPFTSAHFRPATPEEAQPLFDALKKAGKRWSSETLQVEEIPEFDRILEWAETNTEYGYYNHEDVAEAIEGYLKHKEDKK